MRLAATFAEFACGLRFKDLPTALVDSLSLHVLDTIGVCLASTPLPYAQAVANFVQREGGSGRSTAFGLKGAFPAENAGFYNACLGHGMDYDDSHLAAISHPTATILPPLLALAEEAHCTGEELLTALAAGIEIMTRIGVACGPSLLQRGLHPTSACGSFGVVAAVARVSGMSDAQTIAALGIVGSMTGGLHQSTIDGSWNKCIHSGLAAQAGFRAAALARVGFEGPESILDGDNGFLRSFAGLDPAAAKDQMLEGLGQHWEASRLAYKLYPCCQGVHPYADCAIELHRHEQIPVADIDLIEVRIGELVGIALCEPQAQKLRPPTAYAAKFSIPYVVARALVYGTIDPGSFTAEAIADAEVLALAAKVRYLVDPAYDEGAALKGYVSIKRGDRIYTRSTEASRGTPENPWDPAGVTAKFRRNATPILGRERTEALVDVTLGISKLGGADAIARLCRGQGS